jgi:hypothetical protein
MMSNPQKPEMDALTHIINRLRENDYWTQSLFRQMEVVPRDAPEWATDGIFAKRKNELEQERIELEAQLRAYTTRSS